VIRTYWCRVTIRAQVGFVSASTCSEASLLHSLMEARMTSNTHSLECARSRKNGSRGEEKQYWASALTFEQIRILIMKAEHTWQVLLATLDALEMRERDLRAKLRRTETRLARVRPAEKGLEGMMVMLFGAVWRTEATVSQVAHAVTQMEELLLMLFDVELLRGCVDVWYAREPQHVPHPAEESTKGRWLEEPDRSVYRTSQVWPILCRSWMSGGVDPVNEYWHWDMEDDIDGDLASVSACVIAAGSLERVFERIRSALYALNRDAVDAGTQESVHNKHVSSGQLTWPQTHRLRMSDLQYTRASITGVVRGESTLESLLRDLRFRKLDPTRHPSTVIEVVKVNGTYYSNDNRRLNVLRDYMHDAGRDVHVWCRVFEWHRSYEEHVGRFMDRVSADYRHVSVRTALKLATAKLPQPSPLQLRGGFADHSGRTSQQKRQYPSEWQTV